MTKPTQKPQNSYSFLLYGFDAFEESLDIDAELEAISHRTVEPNSSFEAYRIQCTNFDE